MVSRVENIIVPHPADQNDRRWLRIINENFSRFSDVINRAIQTGGLIAPGVVTEAMLDTDAKTLVGDVTGTIGSTGSTSVVKIRGKSIASPAAGDDGKAIVYNHGGSRFTYADKLTDVLTTRGDLLVRGASAEDRLAVGAANRILKSDGTDPSWATLTSMIDAVFGGTRGQILKRGAANWEVLGIGASGKYLYSDGTDPSWGDPPAAGAHSILSATHSDSTSAAVVRGDIITGQGATPAWTRLAIGASGKYLKSDGTDVSWGDPPASTAHNLLSATHSDTTSATVVRGDIIVGKNGPVWERMALGTRRYLLSNDGTDVTWDDPKRFGLPGYYTIYMRASFAYGITILTGGNSVVQAATGTGTVADAADANRAATKWTNATTGVIGWRCAGNLHVQTRHRPYMRFDMKLNDINDGCVWAGLCNLTNGSTLADPAVALAAFRARNTTDTNFQACTHDGTTLNANDTGVAIDTAWHDFEIFTDDAGVTFYFYIDGALVATETANVPGTSTPLQPQVLMAAVSSSARDIACSYAQVLLGQRPTV